MEQFLFEIQNSIIILSFGKDFETMQKNWMIDEMRKIKEEC